MTINTNKENSGKTSIQIVCKYDRIVSTDKYYPLFFHFKPDNILVIKLEKDVTEQELKKLLDLASNWCQNIKCIEIKRNQVINDH